MSEDIFSLFGDPEHFDHAAFFKAREKAHDAQLALEMEALDLPDDDPRREGGPDNPLEGPDIGDREPREPRPGLGGAVIELAQPEDN